MSSGHRELSVVEQITLPTADLPEEGIPCIFQPTEADEYLQRQIMQIVAYLQRQRKRKGRTP